MKKSLISLLGIIVLVLPVKMVFAGGGFEFSWHDEKGEDKHWFVKSLNQDDLRGLFTVVSPKDIHTLRITAAFDSIDAKNLSLFPNITAVFLEYKDEYQDWMEGLKGLEKLEAILVDVDFVEEGKGYVFDVSGFSGVLRVIRFSAPFLVAGRVEINMEGLYSLDYLTIEGGSGTIVDIYFGNGMNVKDFELFAVRKNKPIYNIYSMDEISIEATFLSIELLEILNGNGEEVGWLSIFENVKGLKVLMEDDSRYRRRPKLRHRLRIKRFFKEAQYIEYY